MKRFMLLLFIFSGAQASLAQNVGLAFSYFIPRNGEFSTPISPFSIRGIGVDINRFIALETGVTLYRMSGLNVIDLPFESIKFTILVDHETYSFPIARFLCAPDCQLQCLQPIECASSSART